MADNGHHFIGLTVYYFRNFIFDWMREVYGCYILFSRSVHEPLKQFEILSLLDIIYGSDEEFESFHSDQPPSNVHGDLGHPNFTTLVC